jgi:hypothetical protein
VQEVFSPMVVQLNSELLAISEQMLIPLLTKATQDQQKELTKINKALEFDDSYINIKKSIKIDGNIIIDKNANININDANISGDIITKNKFSIKRMDSLDSLMSVSDEKEFDDSAKGYLSVRDVYLADSSQWAGSGAKFETLSEEPKNSQCTIKTKGKVIILENTSKMYICNGISWDLINTENI